MRVLLAAGAVFGVGAVATVSAWTDEEYVTASFTSTGFELESETEGAAFASHPGAPGAALVFDVGALLPGTTSYAWMNLRTTTGTTLSGTVRLTSATVSGDLPPFLEYRAVRTPDALAPGECTAATFSDVTATFIVGGPVRWEPVTDEPPAPAVFPIGPEADDLGICFQVRLAAATADDAGGRSGTVTWGFTGSSS